MPDTMQAIFILVLTLPGFLGYLVFNRLRIGKFEDAFEKIGCVILFNVLAIVALGLLNIDNPLGNFKSAALTYADMVAFGRTVFPLLTLFSALFAIAAALILNSDKVSYYLIKAGLTRRSSHVSVIADVIAAHPDCFMKFRYKSGGYVIGHPRRYSLDGGESAIFLSKAARRPPKSPCTPQPPEKAIEGPGVLLVNFDDILAVEILDGV
ncbi:MAG: hypothetical protein J0G94_18110 [Sphingomonadales bacterium]|nr:hypothetical protein [Sphingomonadales bacterium]